MAGGVDDDSGQTGVGDVEEHRGQEVNTRKTTIPVITPAKVLPTAVFDLIAERGNDQAAGYLPKNAPKILVISMPMTPSEGLIG